MLPGLVGAGIVNNGGIGQSMRRLGLVPDMQNSLVIDVPVGVDHLVIEQGIQRVLVMVLEVFAPCGDEIQQDLQIKLLPQQLQIHAQGLCLILTKRENIQLPAQQNQNHSTRQKNGSHIDQGIHLHCKAMNGNR